jgi:hypothetical protein
MPMQSLDEWLARSEHHYATIIANRGKWSCRLLEPAVYPDLEPGRHYMFARVGEGASLEEAVTKALEAKPI